MTTLHARRYDTGEPVAITMRGSQIWAIDPVWPGADVADWPFVAPGLFDLQINGYGGTWYCDPALTPERFLETLPPYLAHGTTRICPTLITSSHAALAGGFHAIAAALDRDPRAALMVSGLHLEGPFISSEDGPRGAHPREHVRPADWAEFEELQRVAGGRIRLVTLAPEVPGAIDFIRRAVAAGVVIAIGHTNAGADEIAAAVDAGARLSTHLGNGSHPVLPRHHNYIWEQLADPRLYASVISDGHHLPATILRTILRTKTPLRTIITCDASGWAGMPPGEYAFGSLRVELLPSGRIVPAGQPKLLAGSSLCTDHCVKYMVEQAGASWRDAIEMASRHPARLLGFPEHRLAHGSRADLFLFDVGAPGEPMRIHATLLAGEVAYGALPELAVV